MNKLIICFLLTSPIEVVYEPNERTDEIIVYNRVETPKDCVKVTYPEKEKNQKTPAISYDELNDAFHSLLNDFEL